MAHSVTRGERLSWAAPEDVLAGSGLRVAPLAGAGNSSVHLEIRLCELPPGAHLPSHLHPFEESFYVLSGGASVATADTGYRVREGDYGFAPVATPHAWRNDTDGLVRWLEARAPQPRPIGDAHGTYFAPDHAFPATLPEPDETDPRRRYVGRFSDDDMAPYGPLTMPGYHGPNIRSISIRMLVDQLLGAQHHTLFMVEFAPRAGHGNAAKEHFHPFEEIYYLLSGTALGTLDGEQVRVSAGDLVWTGVNSSHGFINEGDEPVRWLEVQSPIPPTSDAFFFDDDWRGIE
ncbi:MAG: cupin domain-containing protein [Streptosporangiales bacterium]|nr:cupin domain-containing protein [Streptosporangiales bacterium]